MTASLPRCVFGAAYGLFAINCFRFEARGMGLGQDGAKRQATAAQRASTFSLQSSA